MIYKTVGYKFIDETTGKALGRKKRLQAQARKFKKLPIKSPFNSRRWKEQWSTVRGTARVLETYIEFPLLTIKTNHKLVDQGYLPVSQKLIPIGLQPAKG